ncbi:GSU2403 family nucleotidyltransferase fold protein [uncultured Methylobacterium sp.]|uniref:GSU2403 family nucleotidyltransferase fold protein n=1 Tax=uncultured Methylobacterium sp. TaxID=157278 RepID=UPI0035CA5FEA
MSWKTVRGREYLYRKQRGAWKSLGPRSPETEAAHRQFHVGRDRGQDRLAGLTNRLDAMAPVNRALQLGRMPMIAARVLRALSGARLIGHVVEVVGTNALFAYERLAGVQVAGGHPATEDVDLLFDARRSLRLLTSDVAASGVLGVLKRVDGSFEIVGRSGFRAANRDGYLVDLIMPAPKDPMRIAPRSRIGSAPTDLRAVEIAGLAWLVNAPKVDATIVDARGYPLGITVPDPRAFALHKSWLSERPDRDPIKRQRDAAQADLVARLVRTRLPHLSFTDPALAALPQALRDRAPALAGDALAGDALAGEALATVGRNRRLEPDW